MPKRYLPFAFSTGTEFDASQCFAASHHPTNVKVHNNRYSSAVEQQCLSSKVYPHISNIPILKMFPGPVSIAQCAHSAHTVRDHYEKWGTAGEAGTGNVVEAVRHCRAVMGAIKQLQTLDEDELYVYAKVCMCSLRPLHAVSQALCDHVLPEVGPKAPGS